MAQTQEDPLNFVPGADRAALLAAGLDPERLREHMRRARSEKAEDNYVTGAIAPPAAGDVESLPEAGSDARRELERLGLEALKAGQVALIVLAGGMATRMGGKVKALVDALPGHSFLDLRLNEAKSNAARYGAEPPLWIMTSYATDRAIRQALGERVDGERIGVFSQFISLRLTPEGDVFVGDDGKPSLHAPGHGDLPEALQKSGLIQRFVARGGRVVMMTNIDNLGGTLDPAIVGFHLSRGAAVTLEVVDKVGSDRGGIPARLDGRPVVLEEFRIPPSFDPKSVAVFSTNVFHFDARALAELSMPWTFFRVTKQVDGRPALQFERLVNEVTFRLPSCFLRVPRSGVESRFLPVKDNEELAARRAENELVARNRGMLP
jgi:UTP--glucose-1-phosphate uridylyltransferase